MIRTRWEKSSAQLNTRRGDFTKQKMDGGVVKEKSNKTALKPDVLFSRALAMLPPASNICPSTLYAVLRN